MYIIYFKLNYYSGLTQIVRVEIDKEDLKIINKPTLDALVYTRYGRDIVESYTPVTKEEYDDYIKHFTTNA